jgi:phenylacetic acid degradation operon negative regulatory protein
MKIDYEKVLDFFFWGLEVFSRRDCGLILAGYRICDSEKRANQMLSRLRQQHWIEQQGRGATARFRITGAGRRVATALSPDQHWNKPWDGNWRVFSYDLPELRRTDRVVLWRELRARKLGLLQRSVWVWPHDVEALLMEVVEAHGIPECFCGFESHRLFLCADSEVVTSAWDFEEIARRHESYLDRLVARLDSVRAAKDLPAVARTARAERDAYDYAFSLDPLLPRRLWPKSYKGPVVEQRHQRFRADLRARAAELAS